MSNAAVNINMISNRLGIVLDYHCTATARTLPNRGKISERDYYYYGKSENSFPRWNLRQSGLPVHKTYHYNIQRWAIRLTDLLRNCHAGSGRTFAQPRPRLLAHL